LYFANGHVREVGVVAVHLGENLAGGEGGEFCEGHEGIFSPGAPFSIK
jgi:hypothetical protein